MITEKQVAQYLWAKGFEGSKIFIREMVECDDSLVVDLKVIESGYEIFLMRTIKLKDLEKYE